MQPDSIKLLIKRIEAQYKEANNVYKNDMETQHTIHSCAWN